MRNKTRSKEMSLLSAPHFSNYDGESAFVFQGKTYRRQIMMAGCGGYGKVFCFESEDGSKLAVKSEISSHQVYNYGKEFQREATFYKKIYGVGELSGIPDDFYHPHYILFPYFEGKTLGELSFQSEKETLMWWIKTADAVNQLHQMHRITHCDLKSDNVMVGLRADYATAGMSPAAYLIDFGLAAEAGSLLSFHLEQTQENYKLYAQYAPELFSKNKNEKQYAHFSQDLYSLGILLLALHHQHLLINSESGCNERNIALVCGGLTKLQPSERWSIPKSIYMLIIGFFSQVPQVLLQNGFDDARFNSFPVNQMLRHVWKNTVMAVIQARRGELEVELQNKEKKGEKSSRKSEKIAALKKMQSDIRVDYPQLFKKCVSDIAEQFPQLTAGIFSKRTKITLDELNDVVPVFH